VISGERLAAKLQEPNTYLLLLKVQSAGGETVKYDGLFFLAGPSYHYSGGAIVSVTAFAPDGRMVAARTFWGIQGDIKAQRFTKVVRPAAGAVPTLSK